MMATIWNLLRRVDNGESTLARLPSCSFGLVIFEGAAVSRPRGCSLVVVISKLVGQWAWTGWIESPIASAQSGYTLFESNRSPLNSRTR